MSNCYRKLKYLAETNRLSTDELISALMATVYLHCCEGCIEELHSGDFFEALQHMVTEMRLCRDLRRHKAA